MSPLALALLLFSFLCSPLGPDPLPYPHCAVACCCPRGVRRARGAPRCSPHCFSQSPTSFLLFFESDAPWKRVTCLSSSMFMLSATHSSRSMFATICREHWRVSFKFFSVLDRSSLLSSLSVSYLHFFFVASSSSFVASPKAWRLLILSASFTFCPPQLLLQAFRLQFRLLHLLLRAFRIQLLRPLVRPQLVRGVCVTPAHTLLIFDLRLRYTHLLLLLRLLGVLLFELGPGSRVGRFSSLGSTLCCLLLWLVQHKIGTTVGGDRPHLVAPHLTSMLADDEECSQRVRNGNSNIRWY